MNIREVVGISECVTVGVCVSACFYIYIYIYIYIHIVMCLQADDLSLSLIKQPLWTREFETDIMSP